MTISTWSRNILATLTALAAGCSSSDGDPPLTDATALQCPTPGNLPFRLATHGFQQAANQTTAKQKAVFKDEASDILGNPGGPRANVYLADTAAPGTTAGFEGAKARTAESDGLFATPLAGEHVSLWFYDTAATAWTNLDSGVTDDQGHYALTDGGMATPDGAAVYAMLEADGSCAAQHAYAWPTGSKFVVMDIDGTLTTSDDELITQLGDETYTPKMMVEANTLAQTWVMKGYHVVYLTARPHVFDAETRGWLAQMQFPDGPVITENGGEAADAYKTTWLQRMITTFGWTAYAAYGNAGTDITAYANVGIPLDRTFIIGPNGGQGGTVAIANGDYTSHIATFVSAQPDNH